MFPSDEVTVQSELLTCADKLTSTDTGYIGQSGHAGRFGGLNESSTIYFNDVYFK